MDTLSMTARSAQSRPRRSCSGVLIEFSLDLESNVCAFVQRAMEAAAEVGDQLGVSAAGGGAGPQPLVWSAAVESLHALSTELGLPELADLADIMRLSGQEGAQVYSNLRARSAGMRAAMLNAELAKANEIGKRMLIPMSILGVIFLCAAAGDHRDRGCRRDAFPRKRTGRSGTSRRASILRARLRRGFAGLRTAGEKVLDGLHSEKGGDDGD
jgi:hypothetical protein